MTTVQAATTAVAMLLAAAGMAQAQTPTDPPAGAGVRQESTADITGEIELSRAAIQVRRQALVTAAMDLDGKEAEAFWPLYRDYRLAMATVNDRYVRLLVSYLEAYDSLTEESAKQLVDEYLGIERDRTGVKATFVPRFAQVMPARKVARFFQVDNKLDAMINGELAQMIPLIR